MDLGSSCPNKGLGATPRHEWQAGRNHNLWRRRLPFIWGVLVVQLCPTLCNPMDYSQPGSSVHGIFQSKILEWVTISFSRCILDPGIKPGSSALQADSLPSEPPGKSHKSHICLLLKKFGKIQRRLKKGKVTIIIVPS